VKYVSPVKGSICGVLGAACKLQKLETHGITAKAGGDAASPRMINANTLAVVRTVINLVAI
jgi:hypothetical protein